MSLIGAGLLLYILSQAVMEPFSGASSWQRKDYTDSFSGNALVSFSLTGRFLDAPQRGHLESPVWVTVCEPKASHNGKNLYEGLLSKSYIDFGTVLNSRSPSSVPIIYRLDDGKPNSDTWTTGTDLTAAFLSRDALNIVLYGHFLPHRAGSNPPTKKLVLKVDEFQAASIVVEFDIPDPDQMARACGTTYHQK